MRKPASLLFPIAILALCSVSTNAQQIRNAVPELARPLPLSAVRVTGGPLKQAQDLNIKYLLSLEPDRMMAYYRKRAGLEPKASGYTGWDGDGRNLTGHIAGHYLSAVSLMYAATADARFKERADYLVKELKEVQDKHGDGYLSALEGAREKWAEVAQGNIRSTFFDLNGMWSPWYTLHKTFAGLRDAYRYTGNRTALEVETKFAAWAESIVAKLDAAQTQKMLNTEFGGMNEALADLYADTGDKRWLNLSHRFDHDAVLDPLARSEDILAGLHGNTQVPKLLGHLMRYIYTGDKKDGAAAEFFWDAVALHHSYATGGHGRDEYYGPPDQLGDRVEGRTNESCNVYNMLKMTRRLFAIHPKMKYAEFEERALFNHVLASIDPEDGRTCYMVPIGRGVQHEYQDMARSFTCCVGSGMESHALHGDGIYYESRNKLWVNLYVPSTAGFQLQGVRVAMDTSFPEGESATLKLTLRKPGQLTVALRRPSWAGDGFTVNVNGKAVENLSAPGSYIEIKRRWKTGDTIALVLPKTLRLEPTLDNPNRVALMWGPLVLAGDLGPERDRRSGGAVPTTVTPAFVSEKPVAEWLTPVADKFHAAGRDTDDQLSELNLVPFYRLHRRTYAVYFDLYNSEDWKKKLAEFAVERERLRKVEAATISFVQPGDGQKEKEFSQQGEESTVDRALGRLGRRGKKWFSFDLPVEVNQPAALIATYLNEERARRTFEILADGQRIGEQTIERTPPGSATGSFFDVQYKLPAELLKDKKKITVRFQATNNNEIAAVYGVRLVRTEAPQPGASYLEFETPDFKLKLATASQTIAALQPKAAPGFDFTPGDRLDRRAANGYHHLGDLTLRLRTSSDRPWQDYDTATARKEVQTLPASGNTLAIADLSASLPADIPVQVTRSWSVEDGRLVLRFDIKNKTTTPVQIGALGIPMIFNNILTGRDLKEAHEKCSFSDPYIGQDAGYLQVTRLSGLGPALVVVPDGETPFEAYHLLNEPTRPSQTFEGAFAWMVHTQAYAENEWKNVNQWNPPTGVAIMPGATRTYAVKFLLSDQIRNIEKTLIANERPVAVGVPGYVLPLDLDARLFLNYSRKVRDVRVEPQNAITIREDKPTRNGWKAYTLRGQTWGRARLTLTYDDNSKQSINYYVIKPQSQAVSDLGHFLFTKQWFDDPDDPFHRAPSVISYDRETNRQVTQDSRAWIAGLGDEGGSGSWLAAALKQLGQPNRDEIAKYEQFIDKVLWGRLQYSDGPNKYGVRKSLFYYSPPDVAGFQYDPALNWTTWTSWKKTDAESIGRGYNYPHVVAAYWSMYRVTRNHSGLVTNHPWNWYLEQAYETTKFTFSRAPDGRRRVGYVELGLMDGSIFLALLTDLKREGWTTKANEIENLMKERAGRWKNEAYPFGSEMAWDSTGQEEVYAWCDYFGYDDKAEVSLNSIIGYMPTLPHWGYNGNARRYWDFIYGGKLRRYERQLHHYGSGLNAIPVLARYREHPDDFYLLRVGYGGTMGALTNIDQEGFASVAFHSFPATLKWDGYSGDYGPNFFGHAFNTATYIVDHPEFGWLAFGGNVRIVGEWIKVQPLDSFRQRVYVAPRGLWLTLDAGTFEAIELNTRTSQIRIGFSPQTPNTSKALLRVEQPAGVAGVGAYRPRQGLQQERDAYAVPLKRTTSWIELTNSLPRRKS